MVVRLGAAVGLMVSDVKNQIPTQFTQRIANRLWWDGGPGLSFYRSTPRDLVLPHRTKLVDTNKFGLSVCTN